MKKLKDPEQGLERFFDHVGGLGEKLGPVVFQLPPFLELNLERLETFPGGPAKRGPFAFEFRNPTWHCDQVYRTLARFNAAFCPFDIAGFQSPDSGNSRLRLRAAAWAGTRPVSGNVFR